MKTLAARFEDLAETWFLVDAKDQIVGRLASRIALVLRGKQMANFSPHVNMRTHVVVVNAKDVVLTANKWKTKTYYRHSGWPGGIKAATAAELREKKPTEILRHAVRGMLPKNRLGEATMKRLRIFAGPEHRHKAQQPQPLNFSRGTQEGA